MTNIRKELVLDYIRKYNPPTIVELEDKLDEVGIGYAEEDLLQIVLELESKGLVRLAKKEHNSFVSFIRDPDAAWWVYSIIFVFAVEELLVVYSPQNVFLLGLRLLFGL